MTFAKIIVQGDYKEKGDLVFRPLIRAYKEVGADSLIENGNAILLGVVDNEGAFHECFTGNVIDYHNYIELGFGDIHGILSSLSKKQLDNVVLKIRKLIFNDQSVKEDNDYDDVKRMIEEDARDLSIERIAYENDLSLVNPFDKSNLLGYRNFAYKCSVINEFLDRKKNK